MTDKLISIAAQLATCKPLHNIERICEDQATVSTRVLQRHVDVSSNMLRDYAYNIRQEFKKSRTLHICNWKRDDEGIYHGPCGVAWYFDVDGREENNCNYCPQCGGKIHDVA